jgi:chromate transport protein ChrA
VALAVMLLGTSHVFVDIGVFFSKLAVVSFGGAYALMAYMAQQAVENYGWMSAPEMVDGLGLAETLPGPLIKVTQFVGFLAAWRSPEPFSPLVGSTLGSALTTWVTFVPPILLIFAGAPFVEQLRANPRLSGALNAITAAVVGVILNLTVWFALHVLFAQVVEARAGPLRWYAFDPASIDLKVSALALLAALLAFVLHRGLIQLVVSWPRSGSRYDWPYDCLCDRRDRSHGPRGLRGVPQAGRGGEREVRRQVPRARRQGRSAGGRRRRQAAGDPRVPELRAGAEVVPLHRVRAAHQAAPEGVQGAAGSRRGRCVEIRNSGTEP